jgi:hypothetical protein
MNLAHIAAIPSLLPFENGRKNCDPTLWPVAWEIHFRDDV